VAQSLGLKLPAEIVAGLKVANGRPPMVLNDAVAQAGGGMIVLGGKHHSALGRWLGGSTSHNMVRAAAVPVLVTAGEPREIERILVSVDVSPAAKPTLELAERFAGLLGAKLRAISVMEPLPLMPEAPPVDLREYYDMWEEMLKRDVWPLLRTPGVETIVRHGNVIETLLREVHEWPADLLVVGSHGKNLAQRMLLGSVTEQLLNHLPTSVLVAPIAVPQAEMTSARVSELALA
jgi:nucleotide-binding universal stress UspA family protein